MKEEVIVENEPATDKNESVDKITKESDNKESDILKAKFDEVLTEKKRLQKRIKEIESQAESKARQEAEARGEFEQLYKSASNKNKELLDRLQQIEQEKAQEQINAASLKISAEIADGSNAELLSVFVAKRIKYVEGEVKVLDSKGQLTVSTLDDLKKEFARDEKFKPLLRGSQATGGGASGAGNGVPTKKTMSRARFNALENEEKSNFMRSGGTLFDE